MRSENPAKVMKDIGRRVAELRHDRTWTQAHFAELLEVTTNYIARIEAGRENLSIQSLVSLANALGVRSSALWDKPNVATKTTRGRPKSR